MKRFIFTCFRGGLLIVLPLWLSILFLGFALRALRGALHPFGGWLVGDSAYADLVAVVVFVLLCFLAGVSMQTAVAGSIGSALDGTVFSEFPAYRLLRTVLGRKTHKEQWAVALVHLDDATMPGFVVEELPNGQYAVFVPSSPTPAAGSVLIMDANRIQFIDVPFPQALRCISQWGVGTSALVAAGRRDKPVK